MLVDAQANGGRAAAVEVAATALRDGLVVALPTDTVYGIGALPGVPGATDRLFALKGRSADVPIAVLCADAAQALALADEAEVGEDVHRIAERLWPGPLTLVLRRRAGLDYQLGEPAGTVGVRCPDHGLVRALADEVTRGGGAVRRRRRRGPRRRGLRRAALDGGRRHRIVLAPPAPGRAAARRGRGRGEALT
jgi:tRNA A37 threonylcarbamoyladenosine synthetase subunit TsaC/SUA5/YrdC